MTVSGLESRVCATPQWRLAETPFGSAGALGPVSLRETIAASGGVLKKTLSMGVRAQRNRVWFFPERRTVVRHVELRLADRLWKDAWLPQSAPAALVETDARRRRRGGETVFARATRDLARASARAMRVSDGADVEPVLLLTNWREFPLPSTLFLARAALALAPFPTVSVVYLNDYALDVGEGAAVNMLVWAALLRADAPLALTEFIRGLGESALDRSAAAAAPADGSEQGVCVARAQPNRGRGARPPVLQVPQLGNT